MDGKRKTKVAKRRRSFFYRLSQQIILFVLPFFTYGLIHFLRVTMRIEEVNLQVPEQFIKGGEEETVILAFWHSRLLMMPLLCRKRRVTMLISRHRDGELIRRAVMLFPVDAARGSTTRGGLHALRQLVRALQRGSHVAVTPDGPRGPRNRVQDGVIILASVTGTPIVPVTFSASRRKTFNSWDRFVIPYPFSRGVFIWGEPTWVGPKAGGSGMEEKRRLLEMRLNQITEEADHYFDR